MRDARWWDVLDAVDASAMHFQTASRLLASGGFDKVGDEGYRNRSSLLYALLAGHTAFEDAMLRVLQIIEEEPPQGSNWHQRLIERVARPIPDGRPAILDDRLTAAARETRSFRHLALHGYKIEFRPERARPAVEAGALLAEGLAEAIRTFGAAMDPAK